MKNDAMKGCCVAVSIMTAPAIFAPLEATSSTDSHDRAEAHSHQEVLSAVSRLPEEDFARLRTAARIWIRDLRLDAAAGDADDLVSEAVLRTTSGQRQWKVGVDFFHHLRVLMRSIIDSWHKSAQRRRAAGAREVRMSELPASSRAPRDGAAVVVYPLSGEPSPEPEVVRELIGREEKRALWVHFAGDEAALKVLEGVSWGMKGPEIQKRWGLSRKQFEAARRRIWRHRNQSGGSRGR